VEQQNFGNLIERVRVGEVGAVDELLSEYGDTIRREVRFNLLDQRLRRVVGESDIFQSVVSRFVFQLRDGDFHFESGKDVVNLLKVMVRARVAQHARFWAAQRRDLTRNHPLGTEYRVHPDPQRSVDVTVSDAELAGVASAIIPEVDRRILGWRDSGMCWSEIGARLGRRSADSVRKAHERCLLRVRAALMKASQ
jgi:hypothetical protein